MQELARLREKHEKELGEMKEMMLRTSAEENKAAAAALETHYKKMLGDMEKTLEDERRMNAEAVKSLNERIEALEKRGGCCVMWAVGLAELLGSFFLLSFWVVTVFRASRMTCVHTYIHQYMKWSLTLRSFWSIQSKATAYEACEGMRRQ